MIIMIVTASVSSSAQVGGMELSGNIIDDAFKEYILHGSVMGADVADSVARKSL
jgi:hypothetical protein